METSSNQIVGAIFMLTSAILLSSQFITAAILANNKNSWSSNAIFNVIDSAGYLLMSLSVVFFLLGLFFLFKKTVLERIK
jgi:hypothetical protein